MAGGAHAAGHGGVNASHTVRTGSQQRFLLMAGKAEFGNRLVKPLGRGRIGRMNFRVARGATYRMHHRAHGDPGMTPGARTKRLGRRPGIARSGGAHEKRGGYTN